jgi:hypothetical protein
LLTFIYINLEPTIGELSTLVKPLIQPPYKPIEVDSLYADRNADDYIMTNAEIIGSQRNAEGLIEVIITFLKLSNDVEA